MRYRGQIFVNTVWISFLIVILVYDQNPLQTVQAKEMKVSSFLLQADKNTIKTYQTTKNIKDTPDYEKLKDLYDQKHYFDLRDEVQKYDNLKSVELLFYRGAVGNKFNQIESSIRYLNEFINQKKNTQLMLEAYELLADNYRKSYQYKKASEIYGKILSGFKDEIDKDDIKDYETNIKLWGALKNVPPQKVKFKGNSNLKRNKQGRIPVEINNQQTAFIFDTGANLSVITHSLAKKLSLQIIETSIDVRAIAGNKVNAKLAAAKELKLDNAVVSNAIFLVFEDTDLFIKEANFQIDGLIGFPVIEGLKEVTFIGKDEIFIPVKPTNSGEQNMAINGLTPLIAGWHKDKRLIFAFDTGADATDLYPLFYKAFEDEIKEKYEEHTEKVRGVGGGMEIKGYLAKNLEMKFAGMIVMFTEIPILIEETNENSKYFYGNIGQDLVKQFEKMTVNFEQMSISFD